MVPTFDYQSLQNLCTSVQISTTMQYTQAWLLVDLEQSVKESQESISNMLGAASIHNVQTTRLVYSKAPFIGQKKKKQKTKKQKVICEKLSRIYPFTYSHPSYSRANTILHNCCDIYTPAPIAQQAWNAQKWSTLRLMVYKLLAMLT